MYEASLTPRFQPSVKDVRVGRKCLAANFKKKSIYVDDFIIRTLERHLLLSMFKSDLFPSHLFSIPPMFSSLTWYDKHKGEGSRQL